MLAALAACNPTKGSDPNAFVQSPTTNFDFNIQRIATGLSPTMAMIFPRGTGCPGVNDQAPNAAVPNYLSNTVTFLSNDGTGTLTPVTIPGVVAASRLVAADLDHSNTALCSWDMVALLSANVFDNPNGVAAITTSDNVNFEVQTIPFGSTPAEVDAVDMNNDGFADIVVSLPALSAVEVLVNDGTGHFPSAAVIGVLPGLTARFITKDWQGHPLDFDGDGCTDVAVITPALDQYQILLSNNGIPCAPYNGGTWTFASYGVDIFPVDIASADWNGDGLTDLLVLTAGTPRLDVYANSGATPFQTFSVPIAISQLRNSPTLLTLGLFSNTETAPVAAIVHPSDRTVGSVVPNTFANYSYAIRQTPTDLAPGHLTAGGNLDLGVTEIKSRIFFVGQGDGTGQFVFTQIGFLTQPGGLAIGRLRPGPGTSDDVLLAQPLDGSVLQLTNVNP